MKKLKLALDSIQVLSFTPDTEPRRGGTVRAFEPDTDIGCGNGDTGQSCGWAGCPDMHDSRNYPC